MDWSPRRALPILGAMTSYATRNHAFVPACTWVLDGASVVVESTEGADRFELADLVELRLLYAPTRAELARFECRLRTRDGRKWTFTSRTYRGLLDFAPTPVEYVGFVRALVTAAAARAPGCRFRAGARTGSFVFNLGCTVAALVLLVVAVLLFAAIGGGATVVIKLGLIVVLLPFAILWVKRNRPREFDPSAIPDELLPGS
ncbi:MAG: hypothetical protein IT453_07280 [Planctomycetes bacterium]|nr:hypothetical protein [Planctomycetota bacterium]